MDATREDHTDWNKSEREIQIPYEFTNMWNLKYHTDRHTCETKTDSPI